MIMRARSRGERPRTSAKPCSVTNKLSEVSGVSTCGKLEALLNVVLGLVDVGSHRDNARDTVLIGLGGTRGL